MKNIIIFLSMFLITGFSGMAQVGINADNSPPVTSAMLDVKSGNKGMLIPQVALTATNVAGPITSPATSLLIHNTATAGTSPNNVTPGYYYWNGSSWARLSVGASGSGTVNYIPKWSPAGTLGNSLVFDNGSSVGIGTTNPVKKLVVSGELQATGTGANYFAGKVGVGTTSPEASAAVDIASTTQGFRPPCMTLLERYAIASPAQGLVIYCNNCGPNGELQVYNGTVWTNMTGATSGYFIGSSYQGGIIAYILQPGDPGYVAGAFHGLIAAPFDQSSGAEWGCWDTEITGAEGTAIGTGNQNTLDIMAGCAESGIAARVCGDLVLNGYSDWYLPSKDELNMLYNNKTAIGGFINIFYWSSSEYNDGTAWYRHFANGIQGNAIKYNAYYVRAVRAF